MKIAICGSSGLLGSELVRLSDSLKVNYFCLDLPDYNVISYKSIESFFKKQPKIDYFINCAAYTDVPGAEKDKKEAFSLNAVAPGILAKLCLEYDVHLIHFSTDFVFRGDREDLVPYKETDGVGSLNFYGQSKCMGEYAIIKRMRDLDLYTIFRLQWLYGHNPKTFFNKILEKAKTGEELKVVSDEFGSPCSVRFVGETVFNYLKGHKAKKIKNSEKLYHLTHNDFCSRYECGKYYLNKLGYSNVLPCSKDDFKSSVVRPSFGAMDNTLLSKTLDIDLKSWRDDLDNFIKESKDAEKRNRT